MESTGGLNDVTNDLRELVLKVVGTPQEEALKAKQLTDQCLQDVKNIFVVKGKVSKLKSCGDALEHDFRIAAGTILEQWLKAVGSLDTILQIKSFEITFTSTDLLSQGKMPKVTIKGRILKKDFEFKDLQFDVQHPDKVFEDVVNELIRLIK